MATHNIRTAFNALAAANNGLISQKADDVGRFKMTWAPPKWIKGKKIEETQGVWNDEDGKPVKVVALGVVDLHRSHLGSYGNCYWNKNDRDHPWRSELLKARFSVDITYPVLPAGHADEDIAAGLVNQLYMLDEIESSASKALRDKGIPPPASGATDWVVFEKDDNGTQGWMRVGLGKVFVPAKERVKACDIVDRSPLKKTDSNVPKKEDIEEDPANHVGALGDAANLKHNAYLPCYKANGDRIGRTSSELRSELYHGRWVKVEMEMVMWNLKEDGKEVYQLCATRLEVLNAPPASMKGVAYLPDVEGSGEEGKSTESEGSTLSGEEGGDSKKRKTEPVAGANKKARIDE